MLQEAAAGSLAAGDITYDNVHKAVFGFNQGQEGRHLLSEAVKVWELDLCNLCHHVLLACVCSAFAKGMAAATWASHIVEENA